MLLKAAEDLGIDPSISFMVGDRAGDIEAGNSAGCKATYLVRSGYGVETLKKGRLTGRSWSITCWLQSKTFSKIDHQIRWGIPKISEMAFRIG